MTMMTNCGYDPSIGKFRVRRLENGRNGVDRIETEARQIAIADRAVAGFNSHLPACRADMTASYEMTDDRKFKLFLALGGGDPKQSGDTFLHPDGYPDSDDIRIYLDSFVQNQFGDPDDPQNYGCACER